MMPPPNEKFFCILPFLANGLSNLPANLPPPPAKPPLPTKEKNNASCGGAGFACGGVATRYSVVMAILCHPDK
ncbi:MAG: hypothetical protein ACR2NY_03295 [Alphaproteobacteria bacterium]